MTTAHQSDCEKLRLFSQRLERPERKRSVGTSSGTNVKMGKEAVLDEIRVLFNLYMDRKEG